MVAFAPVRRRFLPAVALAVAAVACCAEAARADVGGAGIAAAVIRPVRPAAPLGEIRLQPQPGCVAGADCPVTISADLSPVAGDKRRIAIAFDWPAAALPKTEGAWHCRPLTEAEVVCFARPDAIAAQPASRLVLRLPAEAKAEPKLCPRPVDVAYRGVDGALGATPDERHVKLLQAFQDEVRGVVPAVPDGIVAGETRQALQARARELALPTEPEALMVAALVGQDLNRGATTLPGCVALITPPRPAAPEATAKAKPAAPSTARAVPAEPPYPPPQRAPTFIPAPFDDAVLLRPWRVRPLNGLRRLFGG